MNSRRTSAFIVARWLATREFPNEMLPKGGSDRAFVQDLVYTTVRRFRPLRAVLGELLETWPKGELEAFLLVGAAQVLYMPDVPDFAAVNETVSAAKECGRGRCLDRVVNGVLRNLLRRREEFEAKLAAAPLAERESYPNALVARWIARYGGENAEKLAKWHNTPAETWLARPDGFERLPRGEKVSDRPGFAEGEFIVQDPATAGAVELLDVAPGMDVLDFCAAPGGKAVQIAWRMKGEGRLVAQEVNPKRLARLEENLARMRLGVAAAVRKVEDGALFDRVLVDAPCSNTGVIRRRPDARWRWNAEHLAQLVSLQRQILEEAAAHVKPGGRLVYSTCSNEPEENAEQIAAFLAAHPDFAEAGRRESVPFETGCDGAFACALSRTAARPASAFREERAPSRPRPTRRSALPAFVAAVFATFCAVADPEADYRRDVVDPALAGVFASWTRRMPDAEALAAACTNVDWRIVRRWRSRRRDVWIGRDDSAAGGVPWRLGVSRERDGVFVLDARLWPFKTDPSSVTNTCATNATVRISARAASAATGGPGAVPAIAEARRLVAEARSLRLAGQLPAASKTLRKADAQDPLCAWSAMERAFLEDGGDGAVEVAREGRARPDDAVARCRAAYLQIGATNEVRLVDRQTKAIGGK